MPASRPRWLTRAGLVAVLLAYWLVELRHLAVVPRAYEDEAWIASTSWKLATQGVFGTDIQGNFYGMAQHYFGFMPLYPMLQALVLRAAGLGLWQARLTSVYLGLLVCALTFALGRRLFGAPVGLLAVAGLLLTRTAGLTAYRLSGILLIDLARLGRYDIAVPVFGLAACLALARAEAGRRAWVWAALAGALGGLAGLGHVYGWFWLAALGAAIAHIGLRRRDGRWTAVTLGALAAGAALVVTPYVVYVLTGWTDWLGQMAEYGDRTALLDLAWYGRNLLTEAQRYGPGLSGDWRTWLRPGLGLVVAVGPPAVIILARRAGRSLPLASFAWALLLLPVLLALLVTSKVANYLLLFLPMVALAVAWGVGAAWRAADVRRWRWLRAVLLLVCAAVAIEGAGQWARFDQVAAQTTPYAAYAARLRAAVDAAAPAPRPSVLGLHTYWFAFTDLPYTTWYYPTALARTPFKSVAVPLNATLQRLAPDIVLVDARMHLYLTTPTNDNPGPALINTWLAADYAWATAVEDATYGRTDIYCRRPLGVHP